MKRLFFGIVLAALLSMSVLVAAAADSTVVVTEDDLETETDLSVVAPNSNKWFFYNDENDTIDNSLGSFVPGPDAAPAGEGSIQISVSGTERRNIATYQFRGTPLASITTLAFSTYNPSNGNGGSVNRSGYLHFNVDFDGSDTWQRRMIFVPSINGTIVQDTWQEWNAIANGTTLWRYSGPTWPGTSISGETARTWNDILTSYPGVRMRVTDAFLGIRVGEPYDNGYTENIDAFKFGTDAGTTTFDFEIPAPTANELLDQLQDDTAEQVSNPILSRFLQMPLNLAEFAMERGQTQIANLMLLKYTFMVRLYSVFHLIPMDSANSLIEQAQEIIRMNMQQPPQEAR